LGFDELDYVGFGFVGLDSGELGFSSGWLIMVVNNIREIGQKQILLYNKVP